MANSEESASTTRAAASVRSAPRCGEKTACAMPAKLYLRGEELMVSRRLALRGGVLGAIGGILAGGNADAEPAAAAAAAAQRDRSDDGSDRIATAVDKLRDEL